MLKRTNLANPLWRIISLRNNVIFGPSLQASVLSKINDSFLNCFDLFSGFRQKPISEIDAEFR